MAENTLLDCLLSVAQEELQEINSQAPKLTETDIFGAELSDDENTPSTSSNKLSSVIHSGDTDSSDDEGNRNYENAKYDEYGKNIKHLLEAQGPNVQVGKRPSLSCNKNALTSSWKQKANGVQQLAVTKKIEPKSFDVYTDPIFGIRIVKPLISGAVLQERMIGRQAVPLCRLATHITSKEVENDWVVAGVICSKSAPRVSKSGSQYTIWSISDLHGDILTASIFIFGSAYTQLWKLTAGTVVGILNPSVLEKNQSKDVAALSVTNSDKVMILGQSKDFGTCRSVKKNGEACTAIVNMSRSEFCIYHIKKEYQKCSSRSELQSTFAGRGLTALRNKVLGKNEVFYAGKLYTAIPAKKSKKLEKKDESRLKSLSGAGVIVSKGTKPVASKKKSAAHLESSQSQRLRDLEILKKLNSQRLEPESREIVPDFHSPTVTLEESKNTATNVIAKLKAKNAAGNIDKLKNREFDQKADLFINLEEKRTFENKVSKDVTLEDSRNTALNVLKKLKMKNSLSTPKLNHNEPDQIILKNPGTEGMVKQTPAVKIDSCSLRDIPMKEVPFLKKESPLIDLSSSVGRPRNKAIATALQYIQKNGPLEKVDPNNTKTAKKRPRDIEDKIENLQKKPNVEQNEHFSERFKKMMAAQSKHADLLEVHENEEQEKYFKKQEMKERLEEKMATTYKVPCKAVKCLTCKYTNFSAADRCKAERHPLKVYDAFKRFFKCGNCGNRTACLDVVPTIACGNCGSGKWERTTMIKEPKAVTTHSLSIRGGEQTFVNSVVTDANINLLVPNE